MKRTFPTIPAELVQEEVGRSLGQSLELTPLGSYLGRNQVFVEDKRDRVLKLFHHEAETRCAREREAYGLLATTEVPVPTVCAAGHLSTGTPWLLLSLVPGVRMDALGNQPARKRLELFDQLGEMLAALHGVDVDSADALHGPPATERFAMARREVLAEPAAEKELFAVAGTLMSELEPVRFTPVLVHRDVSSRNVLVGDEDGRLRIQGLIDFELALIADPMEDMAKVAFKEFAATPGSRERFLRAYRGRQPFTAGEERSFRWHFLGLMFEIAKWARFDDPAFFGEAVAGMKALLNEDPLYRLCA